jgi:hypothetical protein
LARRPSDERWVERAGHAGSLGTGPGGGPPRRIAAFLEETRAAMNAAREGHWIADTEEVVRDAGERLRQRALEELLQLRVPAGEGSFSPSAAPGGVAGQGAAGGGSRRGDTAVGHVRVRRRVWWKKGAGTQTPGDEWLNGGGPRISVGARELCSRIGQQPQGFRIRRGKLA